MKISISGGCERRSEVEQKCVWWCYFVVWFERQWSMKQGIEEWENERKRKRGQRGWVVIGGDNVCGGWGIIYILFILWVNYMSHFD